MATAKHVLEDIHFATVTTLSVRFANGWTDYKAKITYSSVADVAIIHVDNFLAKGATGIPLCTGDLNPSDNLIFLGFPFDMQITKFNLTPEMNGYVLPFVKHAMFSGSLPIIGSEFQLLVLDALNNHGFSGGPLLKPDDGPYGFCVLGLVNSYVDDVTDVELQGEKIPNQKVHANSGLMVSAPRELIEQTIDEANHSPK